MIQKACAYHPEKRFKNAEDMRRALERLDPDSGHFHSLRETENADGPETIFPGTEEESGTHLPTQNKKAGDGSRPTLPLRLIKGQKVNVASGGICPEKLLVGMGWNVKTCDSETDFDLDVAAFMLEKDGKCSDEEEFIFYGNLTYPGGALTHMGDHLTGEGEGDAEQIMVDLMKIPPRISKIVFTVTIYDAEKRGQNFQQVLHSFIRISDEHTGQEILHYDFGRGLAAETAVVAGELYRYKGEWRFNAIGNGFQGGLEALCRHYGLEVGE